MAKTARDIMTSDCECVGENESAADAAKKLKELGVGAMPICGEDDRLKGVVSDRDIVVNVIAEGRDPSEVKVGELSDGEPVTIGADDSISEAIRTMADKQVRRLPVIDGHELVGIVSQADIAKNAEEAEVGELVAALSSGGDNSG